MEGTGGLLPFGHTHLQARTKANERRPCEAPIGWSVVGYLRSCAIVKRPMRSHNLAGRYDATGSALVKESQPRISVLGARELRLGRS